MTNTTDELMTAWYNKLNGAVTYGTTVPVYKEDVPESETGHYILLRAEGGASANNKANFADTTVIITDIVTVFQNNVDRSVVENIDGQINALILPTRNHGLTDPSGIQILNVNRETFDYITEEAENKYYRKISRYVHRILQQ